MPVQDSRQADNSAGRSVFHEASDAVRHGYFVAPVRITLKQHPVTGEMVKDMYCPVPWKQESTNDLATVARWFGPGGQYPKFSYLIDTEKSGVVVIDLDNTHGNDGAAEWRKLSAPASLMSVRTRTGGYHGYYRAVPGKPIPNSTSAVAPGVDTRGVGGIVFGPGSRIEGTEQIYGTARWIPVDQLPPAPVDLLRSRIRAAGRDPDSQAPTDPMALYIDRSVALRRLNQARADMLATPIGGGLNTAIWRLGAEAGQMAAALGHADELALDFVYRAVREHVQCGEPDADDRKAARRGVEQGYARPWVFATLEDLIDNDPDVAAAVAADAAAQQEAAQGLRAELLSPAQLLQLPPPEYLIDKLLVRNSVARVTGASGSFKSFGVLGMAAAVGEGSEWAGYHAARGGVLYVVAEGAQGMSKRVAAWQQHHGRPMTGVAFLPRPVQLGEMEREALIALVEEIKPALVIFDTQARNTVGVEENSAAEMGRIMHALDRLREAAGSCVLLVHHTGHVGTRGRGSSSVTAAIDTEITFERPERKLGVRVSVTKQKDDEEVTGIELSFAAVGATGSGVLLGGSGAPVVRDAEQWAADAAPDVDEFATPDGDLTPGTARMVTLLAQHMKYNAAAAAMGTGRSRAEAARGLGRPHNDPAIRKAWSYLVERGALTPVSGNSKTAASYWLDPDERE